MPMLRWGLLFTLCLTGLAGWGSGLIDSVTLSASQSVFVVDTANTNVTWTVTASGDVNTGTVDFWQACAATPSWDANFFSEITDPNSGQTSTNTSELKNSTGAVVNNAIGKYTFKARGDRPNDEHTDEATLDVYVLGGVDLTIRGVSNTNEETQGAYLKVDTDTSTTSNGREYSGTLALTGNDQTNGAWCLDYPSSVKVFWETQPNVYEYLPSCSAVNVSFTSSTSETKTINLRFRGQSLTTLRAADIKGYFIPGDKTQEDSIYDLVKCTVVDVAVGAQTHRQDTEIDDGRSTDAWLTDAQKQSPGLYLGVNNDTDEYPYTPTGAKQKDCDHAGIVTSDTDLRKAKVIVHAGTDVKGTWTLAFASSPTPTPLKVWDCVATPSEMSLGTPSSILTGINVNNSAINLEGIAASPLKGTGLTLTFTPYDASDTALTAQALTETLNITVIDVDMCVAGIAETRETNPGCVIRSGEWQSGTFTVRGASSGTQAQGKWKYNLQNLTLKDMNGNTLADDTLITTTPTTLSSTEITQQVQFSGTTLTANAALSGVFIPYDATCTPALLIDQAINDRPIVHPAVVDLAVAGVDEADEETPGAFVGVGQQVAASFHMNGYNLDGHWTLTFPSSLHLYLENPVGTFTPITSGADLGNITADYLNETLRVEGVTAGAAATLTVEFLPDDALPEEVLTDSVTIHVVDCNISLDLQIAEVSENDEETVGAYLPVNDDRDEQNVDTSGNPRPDNQPNAAGNHHIVVTPTPDDDLCPFTVTMQGGNGAIGTLALTVTGNTNPERVKLWYVDEQDTPHDAENSVAIPVTLTGQTYTRTFWLEGISHSLTLRDVSITACFTVAQLVNVADSATVTAFAANLDTDTFNDSQYATPVHSLVTTDEDWHEEIVGEGKCLWINNDDDNINLTTDSEETQTSGTVFDPAGEQFAPLVLTLPAPIETNSCHLRLLYDEDTFRVWTKGRAAARNIASVATAGDLVPSGAVLTPALLNMQNGTTTLWVEALHAASSATNQCLTLEVDVDGGETFVSTCHDIVRVIPSIDLIAQSDAFTVTESSTSNELDVLANDTITPTNPYATTKVLSSVSRPRHGTATLNPAQTQILYTPVPEFFGRDYFTYIVTDGHETDGNPTLGSVWVTVENTNDSVVAIDTTISWYEDMATSVKLLAYDPDGDDLTYTVTTPQYGTLSGTAPALTYTPAQDFFGLDTFTFSVSDGHGTTDTATVCLSIEQLNDAPEANTDAYTTTAETPLIIAAEQGVLINDTDVDDAHEILTASVQTEPWHGTVELASDGGFTYTPAADFFGHDQFTYVVTDDDGFSSLGLVSITVTSINHVPIAVDDSVYAQDDQPNFIDVLSNDLDDDGNTLHITTISTPAHGQAVIQTDEGMDYICYTPADRYFGADQFTYTIADGQGGFASATVLLTVEMTFKLADAVDDTVVVQEDQQTELDVLANDWPDPATPSVLRIIAVTSPAHGTATIVHRTDQRDVVAYTPAVNYFGTDALTYTIQDRLANTDTATVTVTVAGVNDPPVAQEFYVTSMVGSSLPNIAMLAHASDPDVSDTLILQSVGTAAHGTATKTSDDTASYAPNETFFGVDAFTYAITDGTASATSTVWVLINTSQNLLPTARNDAYAVNEDTTDATLTLLENDDDPDADPLSIVFFPGTPVHGTLRNDVTHVHYSPTANYFGQDSFTYVITDGNGGYGVAAVTLTINNAPDSVVANDDSVVLLEETSASIDVLRNDVNADGLSLTLAIDQTPAHGTATVNDATHRIAYTPADNYAGTDAFTYALQENGLTLDTAVVTLTILNMNDAPVAVPDARDNVANKAVITIDVVSNDTDPDGDQLTLLGVTPPRHGAATVSANAVVYTAPSNYFGRDEFAYVIQDPAGLQATASVMVTILYSNDAPVAEDDFVCVPYNGTGRTLDLLANDTDDDGDELEIVMPEGANLPAHGTLTPITLEGKITQVTYTPATDYFGEDAFVYTVNDGHGGSATGSVSVLVYRLTVEVYPGYQVPLAVPARWGVPIGKAGSSIQLVLVSQPEGVDFSSISIVWTGATADQYDATRAWRAGDSPEVATVTVVTTDTDQESLTETTQLVVVALDKIVPDNTNILHPVESGHADNAITGVSADPSTVTVRALVTPTTPDVSAVYNHLIVWGCTGEAGTTADTRVLDRTSPGKQTVSVRCGASRESLAVWAVRANVILAGKTEANETSDDPDVITKIPCNTDDDDRDQLPDDRESNGALSFGVPGEDDLLPLTLQLEPRDLPFGEARLVLPAQSDFAVCAAENKSDGRLTTTTWDLTADSAPSTVYLEATQISTSAQSLTWQYRIGEATLSEDVVVAKGVAALSADAPRARIRIVPTRTAYSDSLDAVAHAPALAMSVNAPSASLTSGSNGPVGGMATGLLYLTLPPQSYVMAGFATIEAADPFDPEHLGESCGVGFDWGANWFVVPDMTTVPVPGLHPTDESTGVGWHRHVGSAHWDETVTVCTRFYWETWKSANGEGYQVALASMGDVDSLGNWLDQIRTDHLEIMSGGLHYVTPEPTTANVQNVVITSLNETATSNQDYIKYDPDPDSKYHTPTISFTAQDKGDYAGHRYEYQIFLQPTEASGREKLFKNQVTQWLVGNVDLAKGGPVTKSVPWNGSIKELPTTANVAEWGTYTYDVQINEYDEIGNLLDWFAYKWPYCLSVSEAGIRTDITNDDCLPELRYKYLLTDNMNRDAKALSLRVVNADLDEDMPVEELPNDSKSVNVDNVGINNQGLLAYLSRNKKQGVDNSRVIITGVDNCNSDIRRDHLDSLMLPADISRSFTKFFYDDWNLFPQNQPRVPEVPKVRRKLSKDEREVLNFMIDVIIYGMAENISLRTYAGTHWLRPPVPILVDNYLKLTQANLCCARGDDDMILLSNRDKANQTIFPLTFQGQKIHYKCNILLLERENNLTQGNGQEFAGILETLIHELLHVEDGPCKPSAWGNFTSFDDPGHDFYIAEERIFKWIRRDINERSPLRDHFRDRLTQMLRSNYWTLNDIRKFNEDFPNWLVNYRIQPGLPHVVDRTVPPNFKYDYTDK